MTATLRWNHQFFGQLLLFSKHRTCKKYSQPLFWGDTPRSWFCRAFQHRVRDCAQEFYFSQIFSDLKFGPFRKFLHLFPVVFAVFLDVFVWGATHIPVFRELLDLHRWGQVRVLEVRAGPAASHASAQSRLQQLGEGEGEGGNPLRLVEVLQTLGDVSDRCSNVDN